MAYVQILEVTRFVAGIIAPFVFTVAVRKRRTHRGKGSRAPEVATTWGNKDQHSEAVSLVLWRRLPVSLGAVLTEPFGASCKGLYEVIVATITAWYS